MGRKVTAKERALIQPLGLTGELSFTPSGPNLRWTASSWVPKMPPPMPPGTPVGLDFEYVPDSRNVTRSRPFAFSVYSPALKRSWYVPWGHEGGGNLPENRCKEWFHREMANRDVYALSAKAEMHSMYNWGLDPQRMRTRPHDVAFPPTLLNEKRLSGFSLASLAEEYLPDGERKVIPSVVPPQYFSLAHSGYLEERGRSDAFLAYRIWEVTRGAVLAEVLDKVNDLEDRCILPVTKMERKGALIDRPKLERWGAEIEQKITERQNHIYEKTKIRNFNPDQATNWDALSKALGIPKPRVFDEKKKEESESWNKEAIKSLDHPLFRVGAEIKHYRSMLSKYLYKYLTYMNSENVIRYSLHQMRAVKDESDDARSHGTVTGRFSCGDRVTHINIQQVMKCEKQVEDWGDEYILRELFIASKGKVMGASDASQIEFRLFSHAAAMLGYPATAEAYAKDPMVDFHLMVTMLMNPGVTAKDKLKALRKHMKHNNFGVLYGMGRPKLARRLGLPCTCPFDWYEKRYDSRLEREMPVRYFKKNDYHLPHCQARQANDIMDEYEQKFPEAKFLLNRAMKKAEEVGFISTLLGRRSRFEDGLRLHKAFNHWDQGSAADVFKTKLYELDAANLVELSMPVHDEHVYDIEPDPVIQKQVEELLDTQSFNLRVPILWQTGYGPNWRIANGA